MSAEIPTQIGSVAPMLYQHHSGKASPKQSIDVSQLSQEKFDQIIGEYENVLAIQQVIYDLANTPFHPGDIDSFFEEIHRVLSSILYSENIIIATLDDGEENLDFVYFRDSVDSISHSQLLSLPSQQVKYTFTGYVLRSGVSLLADKNTMQKMMDSGHVAQLGTICECWLGVPLKHQETTFGVLAIQSYNPEIVYHSRDAELLEIVANHISSAINRKRMAQEMQQVNAQLNKAHQELDEMVQQRTEQLVKANFELHKLLREKEKTQARLAHDALHDNLTGLPNRTLFIDRLLQAMHRANGRDKLRYAVLFIDMDRFKVINDSLGHLTGDLLLKEVSVRLEKTIRLCDSVARFGGDEFCILLEGNIENFDAIIIAERIIDLLSQPFNLQGFEVFTSPSVGITFSQDYYQDPEEVLRDADSAMYQAKSLGKACFAIFDVSMHEEALRRLKLETDLRVAVNEKQIETYYQPIVDLNQRRIVSFECLARWRHAKEGFVSPEDFITIAEETGLIVKLGWQILESAVLQLAVWRNQFDLTNLSISVNLSPKQLEGYHLVEDILNLLQKHDLPTQSLKLEITESVLIDNFEMAKLVINEFSKAGIKIMLDDFGTGYSSLSYLHHFPISIVKIDRSFINNMFSQPTDLAVIKSVESLATGLLMGVVAEGLETEEQFEKLKEIGILYGQGYLFSKPLCAKAISEAMQIGSLGGAKFL